MPELQELAERYAGELHVLGVSIDGAGAGEEIRRFVDELGVDFPILHDARQRVVRRFTTIGVPESFLIDGEGIVRKRWTGRFRPLDPETLSLVDGLVGRDVSRARW
jgi:peroxiredoxin